MKKNLLFLILLLNIKLMAQPGKDGAVTVTSPLQIVNHYSPLSANLVVGSNTLSVAGIALVNVCPGDLIMVYQAQGAGISFTNTAGYGDITSYNSAGLYEFKYVQSVSGNIITTQSTFTNSYQLAGRPQVIKVPQYTTLTVNLGASIVPKAWKDTTIGGLSYRFGGLTVIYATDIINNGMILASGSGFRGGQYTNSGYIVGASDYVFNNAAQGGEKGEGIFGYQTDYDNNGGRYCRGAAANAGGGATATNASGGGGANGFNGNTWTGQGVMIVNATNLLAAWMLDPGYIANSNALTTSSGGGRGGYAWGGAIQNPTISAPGNSSWAGDARREVGGLGGRPLININAESRIYFGGGGGAGQINNSAGTGGGNGGGIVYLIATAGLSGTGNILSDGDPVYTTSSGDGNGSDGSGGGGAGGSIVIKAGTLGASQNISAVGGKGGDQVSPPPTECEGGGGGGGGGFVATSAVGVTPLINGGLNGTSQASFLTTMDSDGATQGASGQTSTVSANFITYNSINSTFTVGSNSPLCAGATLSLTSNATGPFSWSGPNSFTSSVQNPSIINVTQAASGIYSLGLPGGCSSAITSVTVYPQPTVTILNVTGSPSITCTSPTITLAGMSTYTSGTLSYFWASNSFTANTQSITVTNPSTLITLNVSDPITNCFASATLAIDLNTTAPTSSVSPVSQVINCGVGVVATATGVAISPTTNVTHLWYSAALPGNPVSSGGQTSIFAPTLGTNTFVLVNNINGCSTLKTITVTSTRAFPTFSLVSSQNYSIGCTSRSLTNVQITNANADSGAVVSYTILPPGYSGGTTYSTSTSINVFSITTPGTYTVIVRDNNNHCETSIPVSIIQNTFAPDIQVSTLTRTLSCFTPSIMLLGSSANAQLSTVNYTWSYQNGVNPGNVLSSSLAVNINTAVPSNTLINTYTFSVYDQNNACTNTSVVPLYQNTSPPHPAIGVLSNVITCSTPSINLTNASASGVPVPPFTNFQAQVGLHWAGPTPQLPDSNKSTYAAFTPGTYTMTTKDLNNGCTATTTTLIVDGRIYPVLQTNTLVPLDCDVATTGGVKLPVTVQGESAGQVTALWAVPQPPPNVSGVGTLTLITDGVGTYYLTVKTNSNQCVSSIYVHVTPGALTASFTPDKETDFAPLTVNFTNNSSSTSSVSGTSSITSVWSFGNGTTRTTTTNISTSAVYTAPGNYTITMFASKGSCRDTMVKVIFVDIPSRLVIPNIFTPNGDNSNDLFFVQSANLTQITAQIFDRWGNMVYELTSATGNMAWDGKNQSGKEVADGTYFYSIRATGKDSVSYDYKGTVSLYR